MTGSGIDAVIFDWGGTLTPWHALQPRDAWLAYAAAAHAPAADPDHQLAADPQPGPDPADQLVADLAAALLRADDARWATVRDTHSAFTVADVLADAGSAAGLPPAARAAALAAYRDFWVPGTRTDPEAAPMLARLRDRGLRLGVLSSTPWPAQWHEEWLRRDGVLELFDACVWSSDLPVTKPHPDAFRAAMDAVGVSDPARCVFVGDRPYDDISGAAAVGMRAVLVPHSDIPAVQQVPVDVRPDGVIQRLADLPELIADW